MAHTDTEEHDDDDTPNVRDDNHPHPVEAMVASAKLCGTDFWSAFKRAHSGGPLDIARGLVEMQVLAIREGEFPSRKFPPIPPHLPEDEGGMKRLAVSKVPADATIKADLYAWARDSLDHRQRAAKALEVAASAWQSANDILADESCTDEQLGEWCTELVEHIAQEWKVNIRAAPVGREALIAWSLEIAGRFDITPRWLTREEPSSLFDPAAQRRGLKVTSNPLRPFRARVEGDDD